MKLINKKKITEPFKNADGELFYEMIGRGENLGNSEKHSFGIVEVLKGHSTNKHYHAVAEETYYILNGHGKFIIDEKEFIVNKGDTILIMPYERHQLFANEVDIEAIVICAPAWEIDNTIFED